MHAPSEKKRLPLEVIALSDAPDRLYTLINKGATICEADPAFLPMIKRISTYQHKLTRTIRGTEYDFFDFCVKVGLVFDRHDSAYGMVLEIEYRPCVVAKDCEMMATELMEKLAGHLVPPPQKGRDRRNSEVSVLRFDYKKIDLDEKKLNPKELVPFSHRTTALLYAHYLRRQS